jgi:[ribosomal protein S5]-alanine N-acetyltransferase
MNTLRAGPLVLEPQVAAHAAEMFVVLSDPAIYEFENSPPESLAWLERRFARLETRASADGGEHWLNWVVRVPSGALAGYVQATITRDRTAHIAYELASRFWRQGIGSTAVSAMLTELATAYGIRRFAATVKARNDRSLAFLRSLGFSPQVPHDVPAVRHEPDEIVMYRTIGAADKESGIVVDDASSRREG